MQYNNVYPLSNVQARHLVNEPEKFAESFHHSFLTPCIA